MRWGIIGALAFLDSHDFPDATAFLDIHDFPDTAAFLDIHDFPDATAFPDIHHFPDANAFLDSHDFPGTSDGGSVVRGGLRPEHPTRTVMNRYERLIAEADVRPFTGWDTNLDGRITTTPPWNFETDVSTHARDAPTMLDMGTGGGEWLAGLADRAPFTVATETWTPNVLVAARRLHELGIPVVHADDIGDNTALTPQNRIALPFRDCSFALVSNRHESFDPYEIARVLAPGGTFLTQQVADGFNRDYYALLDLVPPALPSTPWRLELARAQLEGAGLVVDAAADGDEAVFFHDIGAFAWYVKNLPWVLPGFIMGVHEAALRRLHTRIERKGPLVARQALFRLRAKRIV